MEPLTALLGMGFPIVFFIAALLAGGIKVVNQYERADARTLYGCASAGASVCCTGLSEDDEG